MFGESFLLIVERVVWKINPMMNDHGDDGLITDLVNIFDVFLPQLLRYPNPNDPLNGEAATLLLRDADKYNDRVRGESHGPMTMMLFLVLP